jgi:hypothetical protein
MVAAPSQTSELDSTLQQAVTHHGAGRFAEAERLYRGILQSRPDDPGVGNALALALKDQGRLEEAEAVFRRITAIGPGYAAAHSNFGNILFVQGRLEEAEASYRRALELRPDMADALRNLALVVVGRGRFGESVAAFRRYAELTGGAPQSSGAPVPEHKIRHDREQWDYLGRNGDGAVLGFRLEAGARVNGRAVNPDRSNGALATQWQTGSPQFVVVDDVLTKDGLEALQRFCWRSTIWHKIYQNGYVGALPEHGFACPLLAQIDEELRGTYPAILGDHPLLRCWAFKCDGRMSGVNIHADFGAVNVNLWITPDEANLDPQSGGLVIWDTPAPLDWNFAQYNGAGQAIRDFLTGAGAKSIRVPYRANRAVIFDSDLFHATDKIAFKDGYLNRRINVTMLYGLRGGRRE